MGMGYCASFADVIEIEDLKKVGKIKELLAELEETLGKHDVSFDTLAEEVSRDIDEIEEEVYEELSLIVKQICKEFKDKTGLSLEIEYHNSDDDGDRYDEVSGGFWRIGGMYVVSPEGQKLLDTGINIVRKFFVTYG